MKITDGLFSFPELQTFVLPALATIGIISADRRAELRHDHCDQFGCVKFPFRRLESSASFVQELFIRGCTESLPRVHRAALCNNAKLYQKLNVTTRGARLV